MRYSVPAFHAGARMAIEAFGAMSGCIDRHLRREVLTRVARPLTLTDFRFAPVVALDKYRQTGSFDMASTVDDATEAAPVLPVPRLS